MIERKKWSDLVRPGEWFHLARVEFSPARPSRLHTHDFPEIFWIEKGSGLHEINGAEKKLLCGDLVFIRASDHHRLRAADPGGFTLINFAFPSRLLADLARRQRLPSSGFRDFAEGGGVLGYGVNVLDVFRRSAYFVGKILKGARPADLPVEQPTKFELIINLKTAKALNLTIPPSLLVRADQVIE